MAAFSIDDSLQGCRKILSYLGYSKKATERILELAAETAEARRKRIGGFFVPVGQIKCAPSWEEKRKIFEKEFIKLYGVCWQLFKITAVAAAWSNGENFTANVNVGTDGVAYIKRFKVQTGLKIGKFMTQLIENSDLADPIKLLMMNAAQRAWNAACELKGGFKDAQAIISADPLDYLTISEPAKLNGWRTCMSVGGSQDGGLAELMLCPSTFVIYTKDDHTGDVHGATARRKLCRFMAIADKKAMTFTKPYPEGKSWVLDEVYAKASKLLIGDGAKEGGHVRVARSESYFDGNYKCFRIGKATKAAVESKTVCLQCGELCPVAAAHCQKKQKPARGYPLQLEVAEDGAW